MTAFTVAVQWLHVLGAVTWFGGQLFVFGALWPALLGRPLAEVRPVLAAVMPRAGRLFAPVVPLVVVTGLLRGTVLGPIRSLGALATPYGVTFALALLLVVAVTVNGGRMRARMAERVFGDAAYPEGARRFLRVHGAINLVGLGLIFTCMILMRFSL